MGFDAEEPLVGRPAGVHLTVARFIPTPVLGEGECGNQDGIDHRAGFEEQAALAQQRIESRQEFLDQRMLLQLIAVISVPWKVSCTVLLVKLTCNNAMEPSSIWPEIASETEKTKVATNVAS